jgi:hypothetical protein
MAKKKDEEDVGRLCTACRQKVMDVIGPLGDELTINWDSVKMYTISIPDPLTRKWAGKVAYVHGKHECPDKKNS